jgi:hypothetical protein
MGGEAKVVPANGEAAGGTSFLTIAGKLVKL